MWRSYGRLWHGRWTTTRWESRLSIDVQQYTMQQTFDRHTVYLAFNRPLPFFQLRVMVKALFFHTTKRVTGDIH